MHRAHFDGRKGRSLWELASLRAHVCPLVARATAMLEADMSRRDKVFSDVPVGEFATASYRSMLQEEAARKLKQVPVAFYAERPAEVFAPGLVAGGGLGDGGGKGGGDDGEGDADGGEGDAAAAAAREDAFAGWRF